MPNSLDSFDPFAPQAKSLDDFDPFAQPAAPTQATPATPAIARPSSTIRRVVGDTAVDLGKGLLGVGEAVVGAGNIVSGGYIGKGLEAIGYDPVTSKKMLEEGYTPERVAANKEVADAKGFMPTIAAAIKNPSTIAGAVVESAPLMLGGAGLARGGATLLGKAGSIARPGLMGQLAAIPQTVTGRIGLAAAGEGLVSAGSAAESIRQQSDDGLLDAKGTVASLASGAGTAILGALGGKAAQKLGIADVDVALAGGSTARAATAEVKPGLTEAAKRMLKRVAGGALTEGVFEELPQSAQEQMWQNYATGKPIMDGVAEAAAMGALAGGVMGGGFSAIAGNPKDATTDKTTSTETPSGVGRPLSGSIDVSNAPSLDDAQPATPDPFDGNAINAELDAQNGQDRAQSGYDQEAIARYQDQQKATIRSRGIMDGTIPPPQKQAADNLRAEAQVMDAQAQTGIGKAAAMATAMQADAIEQSNPFGYQPPTFGYEAPTFPPAPNDGRTRLAQQAQAQGIDPRIVLTLDDAEAGELDQYDDKLLATYAKGLWSDLQSGRRTLPGYNPQEDGRGPRQDAARPVQEQSGVDSVGLRGDAVPDASSGGDAAGAVAVQAGDGAASLAGQAAVPGEPAGAQAEGVIDALSAERRSRIGEDRTQPNTDLDNALNAILIGGVNEQALMDAVRYGVENGRPEIARAAAVELRKSANSAAKQKPGVPEGSPKYAAIAADLARRAQEAAKLADEAEAMATQPAGADEAAGAQAQGLTRDNPLPESEIERAPVGAWVAGPSIPGVADADTVRQVQDVPIDQIDATEFTSDGKLVADKRADASRYAESMRNGDQFPNARGSVLPNGKIKLQDGHRRLAAAIENGATTLRIAVMPPAQGLTPARAPLSVRMGGNEYPVESYEDASAKFRQLRDTVDVGGMPVVELIDQGGQPVGYIGQGGEIYDGSFQEARLNPERKAPVYRPPAGEPLPNPDIIEGQAERVSPAVGSASSAPARSEEVSRTLREAASDAPWAKDLQGGIVGWKVVEENNGNTVHLVNADGSRSVTFTNPNPKSGTEAIRNYTKAVAWAVDNPEVISSDETANNPNPGTPVEGGGQPNRVTITRGAYRGKTGTLGPVSGASATVTLNNGTKVSIAPQALKRDDGQPVVAVKKVSPAAAEKQRIETQLAETQKAITAAGGAQNIKPRSQMTSKELKAQEAGKAQSAPATGVDDAAVRAAYNAAMTAKTGQDYDWGKGDFGDMIVGALNRDPEVMERARNILTNGNNETGLKVFFQQAGIKMPRTQREQKAAFDAYIGVSPETRAASDAEKAKAQADSREKKVASRRARQPVPDFADYPEAVRWLNRRAEDFPSKGAYKATPEFAEWYEKAKPLYAPYKEGFTNKRAAALAEAGIKVGDRVQSNYMGAMLTNQTFTGTVVMRGGDPWVKLDDKMTVSKNRRISEVGSVRWSANWTKPEQPAATHADPGEAPEAVTPAVIADAAKTADRAPTVSMAEARKVLLAKLDAAIKAAPNEGVLDNPPTTKAGKNNGRKAWEVNIGRTLDNGLNVPALTIAESHDGNTYSIGLGGKTLPVGHKDNTLAKEGSLLAARLTAARMQQGADWKASGTNGKWTFNPVPASDTDMITLDVPGDGTFKVKNTKERLTAFRKQVESFFKLPKHETPKPESLTVSQATRDKIMAEAETVDDAAPEQPAASQQQAGRKVTLNKMERTTEGVTGKRIRDSRGEGVVLNANALDDSFNVRWITGDYAGEEQRVTLGDAADVEVLNPRDPYDPEAMRKLRRQWAKEDAAKTAAATEAEKARVATEVAGMEQEARENGPLVKKALAGTEAQREAAQSYLDGEIDLDEFKQIMSAPSVQQADLKGFKREDRGGGAFDLVDGNMRVRVEPTENGKYQAHFGSARSSPHLQGIEGAVAWAATYRDDGSKPSKPQSKPSPSADRGEGKKEAKPDPADTKPNTEDAGEELWANRRNSTGKGLQWGDIEDLNPTLKAREAVKSKVWPRPNYEQLVEGGIPAPMARIIKSVYDAIATKPQTSKAPTDEDYQAYIAGVQKVRDATFAWARAAMEKAPAADNKDVVEFGEKHGLAAKDVAALVGVMLKRGGDGSMLDAVFPYDAQTERSRFRAGTLRTNANNDLALLLGGQKLTGAMQVIPQDIMAAIRDVQKGWPSPQEAWEKTYTIHEDKVGDRKFRNGQTITITEPSFWIASKQGRFNLIVAEGFKTREDAAAAAKALYEKKRKKGGDGAKSEAPVDLKDTREGPQRRQANEDITSDKLRDAFGFKGVNFGNWMKGASKAKMAERQAHLNNAYDSMLDLAEILGIPPRAMSLNGMLGLAIGAQGSGGRGAAHFVPGVNEINLTRAQGAGSLAHEWAHALDHYFATLAGGRVATGMVPFLSEHTADKHDGVRPEVQEAFKAIVKAMRGRDMTPEEVAEQERAMLESAKRSLDRSLTFMRDGLANGTLKTGTGRSRENVLATFDELATRLRNGDLGDGYLKHGKGFNDSEPQVVAMLAMLYRESLGYKYQEIPALGYNARRVAESGKAKQSNATHIPQVPSNFRREALKLDKGSTGKYWSSTLEMFARSFQSYVLDRLAAQGARNDYLTRPQMDEATLKVAQEMGIGEDGDRYPRGDERNAINRGFDTLVASLRTRETDGGNVALESVDELSDTDLTPAERASLNRQRAYGFKGSDGVGITDNERSALEVLEREESRANGIEDADKLGLRKAVNSVIGSVFGLPPIQAYYLRGKAGLDGIATPAYIKKLEDQQKGRDGKMRTAGLYLRGEDAVGGKPVFVLFTDVSRVPWMAAFTAAHEVAGHHGLHVLLGKRLRAVLREAVKNQTVRKIADSMYVSRKFGEKVAKGEMTAENARYLAIEEALADLAAANATGNWQRIQDKHGVTPSKEMQSKLRAFIANVVRQIKMLFKTRNVGFSDAQVQQLLGNAFKAAQGQSASMSVVGANGALEQVVFHGTPHTIKDRFSLNKIGTGEGAQAYGWGMYFASMREVAEQYRLTLAGKSLMRRGLLGMGKSATAKEAREEIAWADKDVRRAGHEILRFMEAGHSLPESTAMAKKEWKNNSFYADASFDAAASDIGKSKFYSVGKKGNLYRVDVPEDSDLLDWDKPLSEQPALSRRVIFANAWQHGLYRISSTKDVDDFTGADLYRSLSRSLGGEQAASEALNAAGIPGLRYLDGTSRAKGEGSANYVIWDESAIGTPSSALESVDNDGMADDDYRGEHSAPTKDSGAPGHDVTGGGNFYPDDVYGPNGLRYYGTGEPAMDAEAYGHIQRLKNHPNYQITVYRAVPKSVKGGIKAGDWVTTVRRYALDHGRGALNGDYKIQSKIVRANEIFTNGDSWLEWGYDPQPFDEEAQRQLRERRAAKQSQNEPLESTEDQTHSEAFRKWFGQSVVTENGKAGGKPLVVYKGMWPYDWTQETGPSQGPVIDSIKRTTPFPAFNDGESGIDIGGFFGDAETASRFAESMNGGAVFPVYLSIQNPYVVDAAGAKAGDIQFGKSGKAWRDAMRSGNYDGSVIRNTADEGTIYVTMRAEQVKSALANNGNFNPDSPSILESVEAFTLSDNPTPADTRIPGEITLDPLHKAGVKGVLARLGKKFTDLKPAALALVPLQEMDDFTPKTVQKDGTTVSAQPAVATYIQLQNDMQAMRNTLYVDYDKTAQDLHAYSTVGAGIKGFFGKAVNQQGRDLFALMHDSTIAGVDPSEQNVRYKDPGKAAKYRDLQERYAKIPKEGQDLFKAVRDAYAAQTDLLDEVIEANATRAAEITTNRARRKLEDREREIREDGNLNPLEKAKASAAAKKAYDDTVNEGGTASKIAALRKMLEANRVPKPYFPLKRYGKYWVSVLKDGKLAGFSKFETAAEQSEFSKSMVAQGYSTRLKYEGDAAQTREMIDPKFVADVEEILTGLPDQIRDDVWQAYLERMPDMSLRKSFIHRKNVAGYHFDALKAFGSTLFHGSHQIARLKYGMEMAEAIDVAKEQANALRESDPEGALAADMVAGELEKRHAFIMNPTNAKWAQKVSGAAFLYSLGANPAHLFLNATQTIMLGVPILGTRYGFGRASKALTKAARDFAKGKGHLEKANLTTDELRAFRELQASGIIEKSQAHDIAGIGAEGVEYDSVRKKVMDKIGWFMHQSERFNREVTAMAGYRLARAEGRSHEAAMAEASKHVYQIHFDYSNAARARVMQGDMAKALLVFRNYQANMIYRLFRDIHQSIRGESPQVKREARKQLGAIMGMYGLFAGTMGVPFYGLAMALAGAFDDEDDPVTAEQQFVNGTVEFLGPTAAKVLLRGIPGTLFDVDLTERIGMGNLWFRSPNQEMEGRDAYYYWMEQLLGAGLAPVKGVFDGINLAMQGQFQRGMERASPAALRNPMQAIRMAQEGGVTSLDGDLIKEVNGGDMLTKALGFQPLSVSEQYEANNEIKGADRRLSNRRQRLMNRYFLARQMGDDTAEAMADIQAFNLKNPEYAITRDTMQRSAKTRARNSANSEGGIVMTRRMRRLQDRLNTEETE